MFWRYALGRKWPGRVGLTLTSGPVSFIAVTSLPLDPPQSKPKLPLGALEPGRRQRGTPGRLSTPPKPTSVADVTHSEYDCCASELRPLLRGVTLLYLKSKRYKGPLRIFS